MYRIMIVDDEPLILAGITSLLAWEEHDCRIVGKGGNGLQALAKMEELHPDIIITDIKMPAMDGITFMKEVRKRDSATAFILLTNMEEFTMARDALALGASAYLVKLELTDESLIEALEQAKSYRDARCPVKEHYGALLTPEELARNFFQNMMLNDVEDMEAEKIPGNIRERFSKPVLALFNFNYRLRGFTEEFTRESQKKIMTFAENVIHEMVNGFYHNHCLVRRELNSFLLVISASGVQDYETLTRLMCEKIISVIKDYFEVTVSAAVSRRGEGLEDFGDLLYQAMNAMNNYYYDTSNPVLFYSEEFETGRRHNNQFNINFMKKELKQIIRQNDNIQFRNTMEQVAELIREAEPSKLQAINACNNLYFFVSSFFEEENDFPFSINITEELNRLSSLEDISGWVLLFGERVSDLLAGRKNSRTDKIMILVQSYVNEHYKEKLTIGQVAESLKISQGYLGASFKKQYGITFAEYVSEVKINKAKELIATHKYLMYEISDMLGFDTQYYFSTVFKKVAGCSPKEFETEILKKNADKL